MSESGQVKTFLAVAATSLAVLGGVALVSNTSDPAPPPGTVLWKADAENSIITPATSGEWAARSCKYTERIKQGEVGPQGKRSYRIEVRDGETPNNAERCEIGQANTSSSNIAGHKLFATGRDYWIAEQIYLQNGYAFAPSCSNVSLCKDGGLVNQFKQTGSCGVPAGGIAASGDGFHYRVSEDNQCSGHNNMKSAFRFPLVTGAWIKILVHLGIDVRPGAGTIELWYDVDGNNSWNPVKAVPNPAGIVGARVEPYNVLRVHTTKADDNLSKCSLNPCSHARIGIYRDEDVQGTSVVRVDGFTVATTPEVAEQNAFNSP